MEDDKRGRLMSFYATSFMGMVPFGGLLPGAPVTRIETQDTVLAGSLLFALKLPKLRKPVRPIYVRQGILPAVAAGIQSATGQAAPPGTGNPGNEHR